MLYRIFLITFLFFTSTLGISQDKIDYSIQDTFDLNTRQLVDKYLSTYDSAEFKIQELIELANIDKANEDYYSAIKKLQIGLVLEKYVDKPGSVTFNLNYNMGDVLSRFSPRYAMIYYNKAQKIGLIAKDVEPWTKAQMYGTMAGVLMELHENDSALAVYKLSLMEINKLSEHLEDKASVINNIGVFYSYVGKPDSAILYYNQALSILKKLNEKPLLYSSVSDNIAQQSELKGDFKTAIKTYLYNDSFYNTNKLVERYTINKVKLMSAMDRAGEPGVTEQIKSLNAFIDTSQEHISQHEIAKFYKFAAGYFIKNGNTERALYFRKRYFDLSDSIALKKTETMRLITRTLLDLQGTELKNEIRVNELELHAARQALSYNRLVAVISSVSGSLIILLLIISLRNRKKKHEAERLQVKAELKAKELEARAAQHELELKRKDITNLVLHNSKVYDANKTMIEGLQQLIKDEAITEQSIKSKLIDMKNLDHLSEGYITIQNNIELINAEFFEKLKANFPGLTKSEIDLCGYLRINLTNKDISILRNVEANSVKKSKTRLRKKLGLSLEDDLNDFIQNI